MPKVKTFTVKAKVNSEGLVTIDHATREENQEIPDKLFDEKEIIKHAQEVSEFNNIETSAISKFGEGDYTIDFKLIV